MPWIPAAQSGRKLTVYSALARKSPVWNHVLGRALDEFNTLSRKYDLGVRLAASSEAPRPDGGADVAINTADGKITLDLPGVEAKAIQFDGNFMHGRTRLLSRSGTIFKAFVFLPAHPKISTPAAWRLVGPKVLSLIAVHELLHACGLEDRDHAESGLFQGSPQVDYGDTPMGDRGRVQRNVDRFMPPFVLDESTVRTLRSLWPARSR